ncbi:hypothetical protein BBO99_00002779 [Phytophthora kernoviae]|uniref:Uncharacterized protein n=1 Tax=Phytophthora kernoviae TaxID=325452 RepID=A0A421ETZ9_9STRA|nr:hypothetical protein BBI17_003553 [Phytophthora kernoviae]RLN82606.1 hypothetical protein BBO99_00002779 [Phytophthora kernoviae]
MYADRTPDAAWIPAFRRDEWLYPISVVGVGRIQCSLNDMLLSVLTPGIAAQRLRSVLMERRAEEDSEYIPIVMPTQATPFRIIGLTRFVFTQQWPIAILVGPREFVLACATGEVTTENGERVGYEMLQSVSRQSQIANSTAMARSQIIQARVFWEQPDGSVLVYNKVIVDAKNRVPDTLKQRMLCHSLQSFWKFVPRSVENKKLQWCLKHKKTLIHELQPWSQGMIRDSLSCAGCGLVAPRPQTKKVSTNQCELCDAWLCSDALCPQERVKMAKITNYMRVTKAPKAHSKQEEEKRVDSHVIKKQRVKNDTSTLTKKQQYEESEEFIPTFIYDVRGVEMERYD